MLEAGLGQRDHKVEKYKERQWAAEVNISRTQWIKNEVESILLNTPKEETENCLRYFQLVVREDSEAKTSQ